MVGLVHIYVEWVHLSHLPSELIPSLIIGAAESYSRAWLSAKVKKSPWEYREQLAEAAWNSIRLGRTKVQCEGP